MRSERGRLRRPRSSSRRRRRRDAAEDAVGGEPEDAWYDSGALEPIDEHPGRGRRTTRGEPDVVVVDATTRSRRTGEPEGDGVRAALRRVELVEGAPSEEDLEAAAAHFAGSIARRALRDRAGRRPRRKRGRRPARRPRRPPAASSDDVEEDMLSDLQDPDAPRTVVVGGEGISGPSWQEPAAVEVGARPRPPRPASANATSRPRS